MHPFDPSSIPDPIRRELPELPIAPRQQQPMVQLHTPASSTGADEDHFMWEIAARLAAGMLANPSRRDSIKDATNLFDGMLQELKAMRSLSNAHPRRAHDSRDGRAA